MLRLVGKASARSPPKKGKCGDRSPAEPGIGLLSPPSDYPNPPIGSTTAPLAEPRQAPSVYYPNYFAGPPAYGYAPSYPYSWAPPGPGVFR